MRQIANYAVEDEPLAKGGMGQIFRGRDEYGNVVAIKEILPEYATDWSIVARLEKEVEFLVKIDHPFIVKLYAAFRDPSTQCYYIVMELVEGLNLEQHIMRNGPFDHQTATDLMMKILDAMQCVHNAHIVHRDIKPSNIMIRANGDVCLLDFGVAKDLDSKYGVTVVGTTIGTAGYMSPEQALGYGIDFRSDIYSLGCVFFYMLTGHHAFNTLSSEYETKDAIINNKFPRINKFVKGVPDLLQQVLDKATDKNMTQRYSSCNAFAAALKNGTFVSSANNVEMPLKISLGREMCDIIFSDPEHKISRHHADIELKEFTGGQYYVFTDCSTNGTLFNHRLINKSSENIPACGPYPTIFLAGVPEGQIDWNKVVDEILKRRNSIACGDALIGGGKCENEKKEGQEYKKDVLLPPEPPSVDDEDNLRENGTVLIVLGFIFAFIGGLLGLILGMILATGKETVKEDGRYYKILRYKKSSRLLGVIISILSIIAIIGWTVVRTLL